MTPEEKAIELYNQMYDYSLFEEEAKMCAIIAVDELIKVAKFFKLYEEILYWQLVKKELTKNKNK